jgi:hypothetical protein
VSVPVRAKGGPARILPIETQNAPIAALRLHPSEQPTCWAHARRKFFEALKVNPKDQSSIRVSGTHRPHTIQEHCSAPEVPPKSGVRRRFIGLPVLICSLDIDVRVRIENLCSFCIGADVELSFVNEKDIWIDVTPQLASRHAVSAKAAILGRVFRRIFVEGSFIRHTCAWIGVAPCLPPDLAHRCKTLISDRQIPLN